MCWFVCHTKPRCEKKFAALMSAEHFEHYLPLLYILAMQEQGERVQFFSEQVTLGAISMRSVRIG